MKRLIKTAKQQFEERLKEVGLWNDWESLDCLGRVGKFVDGEKIVIYIHEEEEDYFSEYYYPPFNELRKEEEFCKECYKEFACHEDDKFVADMTRWLSYGESNKCPLYPVDAYYPAVKFKLDESHEFEDIYEEVPDAKIVTAKEQWDKDSSDAVLIAIESDLVIKVKQAEDGIRFYRKGDECSSLLYPTLEEMRKDPTFETAILKKLMEDGNQAEVLDFVDWRINGGEFPFSLMVIYYSEYENYTVFEYKDKEEQTMKPIEKQDFSEEMEALRKKMIAHIEQLCEQGMAINVEVLCQTPILLWKDGYYTSTEELEDCWIARSDVQNGKWMFYYSLCGTTESELQDFAIDTLQNIIESMQ